MQTDLWRKIVLFLLTLGALVLCAVIAAPFLPAITGAASLAIAARKPYRWLAKHVKHRTLAAALSVALVVLLIVTPVAVLVQNVGQQVVAGAHLVQSGAAQDWFTETIDSIPWLNRIVDRALGVVSLRQAAQGTAGFLASHLQGVLTSSVGTVTQLVFMLFALFFFFRDGHEAAGAFRSLLPLSEIDRERLVNRMTSTIEATLLGSLTIAAIQGALGGIMFWILGVPNAFLWALAMAIMATIPSLGTFLIWMPVAVFLALSGHWVKGAILGAWGTFVISTIDNVLYPTLVGSKMQLHTVAVLFAVLGGIGLFGISGIVLGPLSLTTAITLLRIWNPSTLPPEPDSDHSSAHP